MASLPEADADSVLSLSEECMVTPWSECSPVEVEENAKKRCRESPTGVEASASTVLKRGRGEMKRTPQATLTQSRLTGSGMLQIQTLVQPQAKATEQVKAERKEQDDRALMEVDAGAAAPAGASHSAPYPLRMLTEEPWRGR